MEAELIQPGDPPWTCLLRRVPHDVYHLPEDIVASVTGEEGVLAAHFMESDPQAGLVPLLVRDLPRELGARRAKMRGGRPTSDLCIGRAS